jgi:predicted transcriptional regulator YheO
MAGKTWVAQFEPIAKAMVRLFHPHVEVVMHDIASDTIVGIWNPLSGRQVGDASLHEPELIAEFEAGMVTDVYEKAGLQAKTVSSVSAVIADGAGLFCVNFDRSAFLDVEEVMRTFAAPLTSDRPRALFERDWQEQANTLIREWCESNRKSVRALSRADRVELLTILDEKGLLEYRHAASHIGAALGVSRATVYSTLKAARTSERTQ